MKTFGIIGAGIVGVAAAISLQRAGHNVILIDRGGPASGASFGNAGILAAGSIMPVPNPSLLKKLPSLIFKKNSPLFLKLTYLPRLMPFLMGYLSHCNTKDVNKYAISMSTLIYDTVEQHLLLAKGTRAEKFIVKSDYCFGYETEKAFSDDQLSWNLRAKLGYKFKVNSGSEFSLFDPFYDGLFNVVVRCQGHGRILDPGKYVKALCGHFVEQGGDLIISEVKDIMLNRNKGPRIFLDSESINVDQVLVAAGAWSKTLIKKFRIKTPMESERGYHLEYIRPNLYPKVSMMVTSKKFVITPMNDRIRAAGLVEFASLKTGLRRNPIDYLKKSVKELFPDLLYKDIDQWLGHRPALTDSLPMLGHIDPEKKIWLAFGHQHLGLTAGPKTGRIVADLMLDKGSNNYLSNFNPNRFGMRHNN